MSQHKILTNRALNCIENLKYQLSQDDEWTLFNDLLILRQIVPSLPTDCIRSLLHQLKPHIYSDSGFINHHLNFDKINIILSQVKRPSQLLTDFLACSVVAPASTL